MSQDADSPLTDAELEDVSGGLYRYTPRCRTCGATFSTDTEVTSHDFSVHKSPVPEPTGLSIRPKA